MRNLVPTNSFYYREKGAERTELPMNERDNRIWSFKSDSPESSLSPIWKDIPVGEVRLDVIALDASGKAIDTVGHREFLRDYPFEGPYNDAVRPYGEAAKMAMVAIHRMSAIQYWLNHTQPDMSYGHNCYPCKTIGSTIRLEVLLARTIEDMAPDAIRIAENAGEFLISQSGAEGTPLAYFPPTYYGKKITTNNVAYENLSMTMEASAAAMAFLDLYDYTGNAKYLKQAEGIARTYQTIQRSDGSFPAKINFNTGESATDASAMLHPLCKFLYRLKSQYGIEKYEAVRLKSEKWMRDVPMKKFEFIGQFEDVKVNGLKPYENLTNCTAAPYAAYLLEKKSPSVQDIRDAEDLLRFSEDQFVIWDQLPNKYGVRRMSTPGVFEQYSYRVPIDCSVYNVASGLLAAYKVTKDKLYLAKAKALVDNITINQNAGTGQIATSWNLYPIEKDRAFWVNCSMSSIEILLELDETLKGK
jgi:maltose/maltodextrin transport system substrate-binding protein